MGIFVERLRKDKGFIQNSLSEAIRVRIYWRGHYEAAEELPEEEQLYLPDTVEALKQRLSIERK